MRKFLFVLPLTGVLAACVSVPDRATIAPVEVQVLAFNDFHGALEPPGVSVPTTDASGALVRVPAGGVAHLASALVDLRQGKSSTITVAGGDLTGGSPFISSQFLDEPSVLALNMVGVEVNVVGNHEFDRGSDELLRLQNGGCERHGALQPCLVDKDFPGARFRYLAANVRTQNGETIFPPTYLKQFGTGPDSVSVGFIGVTTIETPTLVEPSAVATLKFEDEADTVNALIPALKAEGAGAIVALIHQGLYTTSGYNGPDCEGITGSLLPILARLDPAVDVVVSGHTHAAYVCEMPRAGGARPLLVTSAGRSGMLVTDISLTIDPRTRAVLARRANNVIVQSVAYEGPDGVTVPVTNNFPIYPARADVAQLVARYAKAAEPIARREVARLTAGASRTRNASGESVLGNLVADSQLAATKAEIAFMNSFGLRADLVPGEGGTVIFSQLYSVQPFGNVMQVKEMTGAQIRAVLEQQFDSGTNSVDRPNMLQVSRGFAVRYDLSRPAGQRILAMTLDGRPIDEARRYRVAVNNFLAAGGDNFTVFAGLPDLAGGGQSDLAALEAYLVANPRLTPPPLGRLTRVDTPALAPPSD